MSLGSRRGSALVISLLGVAVFAGLAALVAVAAKSEVRLIANSKRQAQAQAIAEAGLEDALRTLYKDFAWRTGFTEKPFGGGRYTVTLTAGSSPHIVSTGYAPGVLSTTVKSVAATVVFVSTETAVNAVVANTLVVKGKVDAYDPLVTLTPGATDFLDDAVVFSNGVVDTTWGTCDPLDKRIRGDVYYHTPPAPAPDCRTGFAVATTTVLALPFSACGDCKTNNNNGNINGVNGNPANAWSSASETLSIDSGETVTLSSGTYFFKNITFQGNGILIASTTIGALRIFFNNKLQETASCTFSNNTKIPSRLLVADVDNSSKVDLACPGAMHAYMEGATNHFELATGVEVYGHIASDMITINSGAKLHYDIRAATAFSHVTWAATAAGAWTEGYQRP